MKRIAIVLLASLLSACASTSFQQFSPRDRLQVIDGRGGTKEVVDEVEIWCLGEPPHRYRVLGLGTVEDLATVFADARLRAAIAAQVKATGADAAITLDESQGMRYVGTVFAVNSGAGPIIGLERRAVRFQLVKYVDVSK